MSEGVGSIMWVLHKGCIVHSKKWAFSSDAGCSGVVRGVELRSTEHGNQAGVLPPPPHTHTAGEALKLKCV